MSYRVERNENEYQVISPSGNPVDTFVCNPEIIGSRFRAIKSALSRVKSMQACWDSNVVTRREWMAVTKDRFEQARNTLSTPIRV